MCNFLYLIYGRDTRPITSLNILFAIMWCFTLLFSYDTNSVQLPTNHSAYFIIALSAVIIALAPLALWCECRVRQVAKIFSLMLGALLHAVLANGFISKYPPLDMMMVISVLFTLLFVGAVLYILRCEGLDVPRNTECR